MQIYIRKAKEDDLEQIVGLCNKCFSDAWSIATYVKVLKNKKNLCLVACRGQKIIANVLGYLLAPEGEIQALAVLPEYRKKGIASLLMEKIIQDFKNRHIQDIFLEVRESNLLAIKLYQRYGFVQEGLRRDYYQKPIESALIMHRKMK